MVLFASRFDCFMAICEKAMAGLGTDETTMDLVIVSLEPARNGVLGYSTAAKDFSKLKDGKPHHLP